MLRGPMSSEKGNVAHLSWIRRQPCCVPDCGLIPIHAHHVRAAATAGTALKPSDRDTVPLCYFHHAELHRRGVETFQAEHGVDLGVEVAFYRAASGSEMP